MDCSTLEQCTLFFPPLLNQCRSHNVHLETGHPVNSDKASRRATISVQSFVTGPFLLCIEGLLMEIDKTVFDQLPIGIPVATSKAEFM